MTVSLDRKVVRAGVILVTAGYPIRRNNIMSLVTRWEVPVFHQEISDFTGLYGARVSLRDRRTSVLSL